MSREIGNVVQIRDAEKLNVYFHKEHSFFMISNQNFSKYFPKGATCRTCPTFFVKYTGKMSKCVAKIENFSVLKNHLNESERILGELVAFKPDDELPDKSIYLKHRLYGYLWPFQIKDDFLMFDTRNNKFTRIERKNVARLFTKKGICNYCPCNRRLQSSSTVIKHLQVLETRFYCYLMLDDERYNDERNQERLNQYLHAIKTREINRPLVSKRSRSTIVRVDTSLAEESEEIDECDDSNINDNEATMSTVLDELEKLYEKRIFKMNDLIEQLKNKTNSVNLDQAVIDNQDKFNLIKRNEDFQAKEKDFIFLKSIDLNYEDLNFLLNKYCISDDYEISKSDITLNVQLKECSSDSPVVEQLTVSKVTKANPEILQSNKETNQVKETYRSENKQTNGKYQIESENPTDQEFDLDNSQNSSISKMHPDENLQIQIFEFNQFKVKTENCSDENDDTNVNPFKKVKYN